MTNRGRQGFFTKSLAVIPDKEILTNYF